MLLKTKGWPPLPALRFVALIAGCAAVVIGLGVFTYQKLVNLSDSTQFARDAERARSELAGVLEDLVQMGGGVRPFLATQDRASFADAEAALAELPRDLETLESGLTNDPVQRSLLVSLRALAELRTNQTARVISQASAGETAALEEFLASGDGRRLVLAIRAVVGRMQARQIERLDSTLSSVDGARRQSEWAIGLSTALGAGLLILVAVLTKRHEENLRRTQEELATTLRSIGDAVISTDADGRIRFMNTVAEELTGWQTRDAEKLPLERVFNIIHETTRESVEGPVSQVRKQKRVIGLANHTLLVARDGQERPIQDSAAPIYGEGGEIVGVVLVFRDSTKEREALRSLLENQSLLREVNATLEQKVAERAAQLAAREAIIRTFYDHSSECHAVLIESGDSHFRYEEINPATLRLYEKTRAEVIGFTLDDVFDPKTAALLNTYLRACLTTNAPFRYERVHGDGVIEAIATPIPRTEDGPRRVIVSARDVSERRALEQQLLQSRKMEAVGQLTGGLAHDFNNLLSGISGSFELLQTRVKQGRLDDLERFVAAGQGSARRAAALTHRLLAFSRRQTLDSKPTDINRLIKDMAEWIGRTVGPAISIEVVGAVGL